MRKSTNFPSSKFNSLFALSKTSDDELFSCSINAVLVWKNSEAKEHELGTLMASKRSLLRHFGLPSLPGGFLDQSSVDRSQGSCSCVLTSVPVPECVTNMELHLPSSFGRSIYAPLALSIVFLDHGLGCFTPDFRNLRRPFPSLPFNHFSLVHTCYVKCEYCICTLMHTSAI